MAKVIKAPNKEKSNGFSIFLAGSIDMGEAEDWQSQIEETLKDADITIFNPRRDDWDSSWEQDISNDKFREQVEWELDRLDEANLIVVYFDPKGKAPITLLELGLHAKSDNLLVCCPEGYWRRGNVQIVCDRYAIPMMPSLTDLLATLTRWAEDL